ncbi:MAG: hemolysin family protein [Methanocellales archaeon]|nr:hemolysin family protein [Methanocellales archaeon]MDD4897997.1 hemolysin family protein [Methanocellales archaeon]MDD5446470.1 hemolysin family protein [Methanocellales archaeon]
MVDFWIVIGIICLIFLLILSAFFSAAEMALITISKIRIRDGAKKGDKRALMVENLLKKPHKLVTGIVVGNNFVNVLSSIIAGTITLRIFGNMGIAIATLGMTFLLLLFGEIVPKSFAMRNEKLALRFALPVKFVIKFLSPIASGFIFLSNSIIKAFGKELPSQKLTLTEAELRTILEVAEDLGTIKKSEREMVHEVFDLDQISLGQIMVPKDRIVSIEELAQITNFLELAGKYGISKMPVYRTQSDNIVGVANIKEALKYKDGSTKINQIMKPVFRLKAYERADAALKKMQKAREHLAIVVDEKDQLLGLLTIEDLVEEIVGEID